MDKRKTILEIFSTFIQFENEHFQGWIQDSKLARNMRRCLESNDSQGNRISRKNAWALHWYAIWKESEKQLPKAHLVAYLQPSLYFTAQQFSNFSDSNFRLTDYFQVLFIDVLPTVLDNFNQRSQASLETFAKVALHNELCNYLRRIGERDQSSPWKLLKYTSKTKLHKALTLVGGLNKREIQQYFLVLRYFEDYYAPPKKGWKSLPAPSEETLHQIKDAYNKERLTQLSFPTSEVTVDIVRKWLTNTASWIREYLYPPTLSLNQPLNRDEEGVGEFQDTWIPEEEDLSTYDLLLKFETKESLQAMSMVLEKAIASLTDKQKEYLHLYYREGVSQTQIARDHNLKKPYIVSRALDRARTSLQKTLIQWAQENNTSLKAQKMSAEDAKALGLLLKVWLKELW